MSDASDPRAELLAIARSLRAQVERHGAAGTTGLPRARRKSAPVGEVAAPRRDARVAPPRGATGDRAHAAPERVAPPSTAGTLTAAPRASVPTIAVPTDADGRIARLRTLAEEIRPCKRCGLHEQRTQTVFARGNPNAELCFVGEGPGADEDAQGEPFVGKAGQLLDRMIAAMGFARDEVYVCNIVKCRPPENRKPAPEEMAACMPYLVEQIALVEPKVIVALGATAVEGLLGPTGVGITRLRGSWKVFGGRTPLMPTFHPAYLLRNPPAKREVWADLKAVLEHLGRPVPRAPA